MTQALKALEAARAHIKWLAFGECRADGWEGPPPKASEAVALIDAVLAQQEAPVGDAVAAFEEIVEEAQDNGNDYVTGSWLYEKAAIVRASLASKPDARLHARKAAAEVLLPQPAYRRLSDLQSGVDDYYTADQLREAVLLDREAAAAIKAQAAEVDWMTPAAKWLRMKSRDQESINKAYPDHLKCYPAWAHRVHDRAWLADELDAASAGAEPSSYDPGADMARSALADGSCAGPVLSQPNTKG